MRSIASNCRLGLTLVAAFVSSHLVQPAGAATILPSVSVPAGVVPPPLSRKKFEYFKGRPEELKQLLSRLPKPAMAPASAPGAEQPPAAGRWVTTRNPAPASGMSNPLLLTDGSVIMHVMCGLTWYKLTPNIKGNYQTGSWSSIGSLPSGFEPLYFASQVLNDGRVIINGGEYGSNNTSCHADWGTNGAIYDPATNVWTTVAPPSGWSNIGDAQSIIRFDGVYMLANCCSTQEATLNVSTMSWSPTGSGKFDVNDEEGWAFLPNGRILTTDAYVFTSTCGRNTELYNQATGAWTSAGNATTQLSDCSGNKSYEVGPLVLRGDGTLVAFSGLTTGVAGTSIFSSTSLSWSGGPNLPVIEGANYNLADAPAAVLPEGKIAFAASPGLFSSPTHFFTFNTNNTITQLPDVANSSSNPSYVYNMLTLPTGQILLTDFSNSVYIYTSNGSADPNAVPYDISLSATSLARGSTYQVTGRRLNGITQGNYGDDQQAATNFPLVQITNTATGNVYFAKTHDFSTRSLGAGRLSTASFDVRAATKTGAATLVVIANGVASTPVSVTIH